MGFSIPGRIFVPLFWTVYFLMTGVAVLSALACLAGRNRSFQRVLATLLYPLSLLQCGALALAVRREGMAPAEVIHAAYAPAFPLYALVLAPLGLTLLALVVTWAATRRQVALEPGPAEVKWQGNTYAVAPEAARLYRRRAAADSDLDGGLVVALLALLALDLSAGWVDTAVFALLIGLYVVPWLSDRAFRGRLRRFERLPAPPELLSAARELAIPLGVVVDAAVVDASPQGRANVYVYMRRGCLTVSHRFVEDTTVNERDFLLRRVVCYEAERDPAALARAVGISVAVCLAITASVLIPSALWWRTPFVVVIGVVAVGVAPLVLLLLWLGTKRRRAARAWLRAGNEALASTRNADAAFAAVEKYAGPCDEPGSINLILFEPLPATDAQVIALKQEAARLGILTPDPPTAKGGSNREVPMEPW